MIAISVINFIIAYWIKINSIWHIYSIKFVIIITHLLDGVVCSLLYRKHLNSFVNAGYKSYFNIRISCFFI